MTRVLPLLLAVAALSLVAAAPPNPEAAATPLPASYPEGYRSWTHVKSMAITSPEHPLFGAFGGLHHVYVNDTGLAALREGRTFPDGSVLAFDLLAAESKDGTLQEGPRKLVGIMVKDSARHSATGGWAWEGFAGDSRDKRLVTDAKTQCFACHESQAATDYVFSRWRN